jgi:hypothetical protein
VDGAVLRSGLRGGGGAAGERADEHLSLAGAATFVGLFVPVIWTWTTYAYVGDLFDADEGLFRFVLLAAMLLVR